MKWISVKDRLPINGQYVFVLFKNEEDCPLRMYAFGYRQECYCEETCKYSEWITNNGNIYDDLESRITHWIPLPEGPKNED